ncbi:MAG: tetratricopeptide repeat protein [Alphaproteobacteria bacterium]|nr:tetratricopeptide repeat protein [Alphaproteobacteria bacterium]
MSLPASLSPAVRVGLRAVAAHGDDGIDVAEVALLLAVASRPGVLLQPYRRHLAKMCEDVARHAGPAAPLDMRVEALREVVAKRYGYVGTADAFRDPDAANLTHVMDRRGGLPVTLGIIYLHICRTLGWPMTGIDFPPRFLVRIEMDGRRLMLDPFGGLKALDTPELRDLLKEFAGPEAEIRPDHFRELSPREVLLRLQNTVKARLLDSRQIEDALSQVDLMLLFAPETPALWREAGVLNARLDNVKAAVAAFEEFLRRETRDSSRYRVSIMLQELRARLN